MTRDLLAKEDGFGLHWTMPMTKDSVTQAALLLPPSERADLACD